MRSGLVDWQGFDRDNGMHSFTWSSKTFPDNVLTSVANLDFPQIPVYSSGRNARYWGFPLRCLVR